MCVVIGTTDNFLLYNNITCELSFILHLDASNSVIPIFFFFLINDLSTEQLIIPFTYLERANL